MQSAIIDLTNLRSMTDGDKELEQALFEEFVNSFEAGIVELRQNLEAGHEENWRKQAHALKGISLSLGAENLGELCKKAQENFETGADEKTTMVGVIETEYKLVKQYLDNLAE